MTDMRLMRVELRFHDALGASRSLAMAFNQTLNEHIGLTLSSRIERVQDGALVRATVTNGSGEAVRLDSVRFDLATGFSRGRAARFFKHGYQSWSASYPVTVGASSHPRDSADLIARLAHQSEANRSEEAPEAATSEWFTIVESSSSSDCFLAGFVGSANQLTTLTVTTPDRVVARALLDRTILNPHETVEIEPLVYWRSDESAGRCAARWAATLGDAMRARVHSPYQRGWCSWYQYFHNVTEEALISNLRILKEMRSEYPLEIVQLDDGYQAALGDWTRTNAKFPSGLKKIADEIRDAGFTSGLWTAPFLACRDSQIMNEHPDWFITRDSSPVPAAQVATWTSHEDKFAYALDSSNPSVANHLERLYRAIVNDLGYEYLKLDFLFAAAAEGDRRDPRLTRARSLRRGLEAIRRGAGEKAFILGCGCPLGPGIGIVDGMRIGPDVAPYWGAVGGSEPGTVLAIDAILSRSFMHRRLWLNDPDCLMLRAEKTRLSADEQQALAWAIAASGGMLLISDDMALLDKESGSLYRAVARIGAEVDAAAVSEPPIEVTLMAGEELKALSCRVPDGELHLFVNKSDRQREVRLTDTGARGTGLATLEPESEVQNAECLVLQPHSARIIRRAT